MGIDFKISKEKAEGRPEVIIMHIAGWLDAQSEEQLVHAVKLAQEEGAQYVVLDLHDVDTITSAGIRAIQKSHQMLMPGDQPGKITRLKLCSAPPQIYQVLSITGVLIAIPMYESVDIAVDSFGK
jgi:anti-anti-sigma factor